MNKVEVRVEEKSESSRCPRTKWRGRNSTSLTTLRVLRLSIPVWKYEYLCEVCVLVWINIVINITRGLHRSPKVFIVINVRGECSGFG